MVRWAASTGHPLEVTGSGTKRAIAPPAAATGHRLTLGGHAGILAYEPEELVLTARPGTPIVELEAALAAAGQMFAFEPPDLAALLDADGQATLGGAFGCNFAGPRRLVAGALRDHMLGLAAVSGRGEAFKAGGRVVKNVTGYDLPRALAGSWGTLAVATELTLKVLPRPQTEASVVLPGEDPVQAVATMARALSLPADVSAAAHLPADVAAGIEAAEIAGGGTSLTVLRLEGFGPSVAARTGTLHALLGGGAAVLDAEASAALWTAVRDVRPFVGTAGAVWRCSVAPSAGPRVAAAAPAGSRVLFDWAGGLLWVETPVDGGGGDGGGDSASDAGAAALRTAIAQAGGGHATLIRAPMDLRAVVPTFQPTAAALAALATRLRAAFDPGAVLNPGRTCG